MRDPERYDEYPEYEYEDLPPCCPECLADTARDSYGEFCPNCKWTEQSGKRKPKDAMEQSRDDWKALYEKEYKQRTEWEDTAREHLRRIENQKGTIQAYRADIDSLMAAIERLEAEALNN